MSSTPIHEAKLRLPLPLLMQQLGLGEHAKKSARCPFHEDKHNSFSVWQKDSTWFWKCHAGCGAGDEINFLELHKGISQGDAIKLFLEIAGVNGRSGTFSHSHIPRDVRSEKSETKFNWQQCVSALEPPRIDPLGNGNSHLARLGNERCYSRDFCSWLHGKKLIGLHNGSFAFPVGNGTVAGAHVKLDDAPWFFTPIGIKTMPLVIGDPASAKQVHLFESQWDMLAFADRTDLYREKSVAFIATRGAGNAALVKGLIPQSASVLAWPQNDPAGEKWLSHLAAHAGVPVAKALVPAQFKDVNEWTKAGASPEAIYDAFWRNELVNVPPKPADLGARLDEISQFLRRFVAFSSDAQPITVALWLAHTWALDTFDYTPYLHISSPEKRCGKTRLLDCVELISSKPWRAISPTEAVLFRKIEADKPTLLLDEIDAVFSGGKDERKEPLRALLNAGFERKAKVPRCVGQSFQVQDFEVFCAKAFAGIGRLPDTVSDRCISIRLVRKSRDESVKRFRKREAEAIAAPISVALETWAKCADNIATLHASRPSIPDQLSDRQADICEPLLAIADLAGGEWPQRARNALVALCAETDDDESIGVKLLSAIREVFHATGADRLATKELLEQLVNQDTDAPWAGWWEHDLKNDNIKGPGAKLAKLLKLYHIKSRVVRLADATTRGYTREDFTDAWERYCPPKAA